MSILSTEAQLPCLWGALTSTFSSAIYSILITYLAPQDFDWRIFLLLNQVKDTDSLTGGHQHVQGLPEIRDMSGLDDVRHPLPAAQLSRLRRAGTIASIFSVVILLLTWVIWPLPLYRNYIFSKPVSFGQNLPRDHSGTRLT